MESLLVTVQENYDARIADLNKELAHERDARRRLEKEMKKSAAK